MSAGFLLKNKIKALAVSLAFFVVFSILIYAGTLSSATVVAVEKSFYFLVSENPHVQAGAYDAVLDGGAGYLLETDGRALVALSVYLNENEAKRVTSGYGESVSVLALKTEKLWFKTREEKRKQEVVESALKRAYNCMELLANEIKRLDNGSTQESTKRILELIKKQFAFMEREHRENYEAFSKVCKDARKELETICAGTVYTKDLRYILCALCGSYKELADEFSL